MRRFSKLDDRELDRVLAGEAVPGNEDLDELAGFVRATWVTFSEAPDERTEAQHLQSIMAEASRTSDNETRVEEPASGVIPRSKPVKPFASLTAKLVLAGVLALGVFAGAATAGALPGGIQGSTADLANNVGLDLPDGDDGQQNNIDDGDVNNTDDGAANNTDDGAQNDVDEGAQNNIEDAAQNNTDDGAQNNVDDGAQNDVDDGAQNNTDDAAQNNTDDGPQNNTDDGQQADQPDQGGSGQGGGDQGYQGDGNN